MNGSVGRRAAALANHQGVERELCAGAMAEVYLVQDLFSTTVEFP